MDRIEVRRRVLEAIERGEISPGGPSELAAHDLLDDVPAGYWERWSRAAAARIREQTSNDPGRLAGGGGLMDLDLLNEKRGDEMLRERILSGEWWVIEARGGHPIFRRIEEAHYMGEPGANADFELLVHPYWTVAFARKRRMSADQLAALVGVEPELLAERDILRVEQGR